MRVFGPIGIADVWSGFLNSMRFDIDLRIIDEGRPDLRELVEVTTYGEGTVLEEDGLTVTALRVRHPPVTECFALKFETEDATDRLFLRHRLLPAARRIRRAMPTSSCTRPCWKPASTGSSRAPATPRG